MKTVFSLKYPIILIIFFVIITMLFALFVESGTAQILIVLNSIAILSVIVGIIVPTVFGNLFQKPSLPYLKADSDPYPRPGSEVHKQLTTMLDTYENILELEAMNPKDEYLQERVEDQKHRLMKIFPQVRDYAVILHPELKKYIRD